MLLRSVSRAWLGDGRLCHSSGYHPMRGFLGSFVQRSSAELV